MDLAVNRTTLSSKFAREVQPGSIFYNRTITVSLKIKGALKYRAQAIFGFVCNLIGGRRAFAVK